MMVRTFIIAPAQMKPDSIRWNVGDRSVDGCNVEFNDLNKFCCGVLGKACMAADSQIGAIELQNEARPMDSLIFLLHDVRQDFEILLVALIIFVFKKKRD